MAEIAQQARDACLAVLGPLMRVLGRPTPTWGLVLLAALLVVVHTLMLTRRRPRIQAELIPDTSTWRNVEASTFLITVKGVKTLREMFQHAVANYGSRNCLGERETLSKEKTTEHGSEIIKQTRGTYRWMSFTEVDRMVDSIGRGFLAVGLEPGQRLGICANTARDWQLVAQACFRFHFPLVTAYTSLGEEALVHALGETEVSVIFADPDMVDVVLKLQRKGKLPHVHTVIHSDTLEVSETTLTKSAQATYHDGDPLDFGAMTVVQLKGELRRRDLKVTGKKEELVARLQAHDYGSSPAVADVQLYSLEAVRRRGQLEKGFAEPASPKPENEALIMYTSGSTGLPKGVVISHANLVAAIAGCVAAVDDLGQEDVYVGYLPLAHVLELVAELSVLSVGASIGYSSPGTLSDSSREIKSGTEGDMRALRPTLMAAVPAIMERIRKAVFAQLQRKNFVARGLFHAAFYLKRYMIERGRATPLLDLAFKSIRGAMGGRIRAVLSGGAPLDAKTQRFMNICFCCPVGQGYGLTETCGSGTICAFDDPKTGAAGCPIASCEVKLVDWAEGRYSINDLPYPRGEVVIGGANVAMGYFNLPDKSEEDFREEDGQRWFYSGDIGQMLPDGVLQIIDRKKDLVKLQHGEYISLGKVEAVLKTSEYVENICVHAESQHPFVVALVVPAPGPLKELANDRSTSFEDLCSNRELNDRIQQILADVGKGSNLQRFEIPTRIQLVADSWTPESDMVTPALKLKRKKVTEKYGSMIENLYKKK